MNFLRQTSDFLGFTKPKCSITCIGLNDGIGSQVMCRLSTMVFAQSKQITYLHTPAPYVDHAPQGLEKTWGKTWDDFLGYNQNEQKLAPSLETIYIKHPKRLRMRSGKIYQVRNCHCLTNHLTEEWLKIQQIIQARYPHRHSPLLEQISIHIRRGDVSAINQESFRYTDNQKIISYIQHILQTTKSKLPIHIYSEGDHADFNEITEKFPVTLHLNEDLFQTFRGLADARYLCLAKSSFSYLAALYSRGTCFYQPFWMPALPQWQTLPN